MPRKSPLPPAPPPQCFPPRVQPMRTTPSVGFETSPRNLPKTPLLKGARHTTTFESAHKTKTRVDAKKKRETPSKLTTPSPRSVCGPLTPPPIMQSAPHSQQQPFNRARNAKFVNILLACGRLGMHLVAENIFVVL